jgi:hypothetical protein
LRGRIKDHPQQGFLFLDWLKQEIVLQLQPRALDSDRSGEM